MEVDEHEEEDDHEDEDEESFFESFIEIQNQQKVYYIVPNKRSITKYKIH